MLFDTIKILEGAVVENLTVPSGTSFPDVPTLGELFLRTDNPNEGLYHYTGSAWDYVGSGGTVSIDALNIKAAVRVATTTDISLSGLPVIDGVQIVATDRVLVRAQTNPATNGIYVASNSSWTRASDFDNSPEGELKAGDFVFVAEGTIYHDTGWILTSNDPIVLNTTSITFSQFSQVAAGGTTGSIQYNDSSTFAGGTNLRWTEATNTLNVGVWDETASIHPRESNLGIGGNLLVRGGVGGTGGNNAGGHLYLYGGQSVGDALGGNVYIRGGSAFNSNDGGDVIFLRHSSNYSTVEAFRISSKDGGAWSIGSSGTNFGTSGQVLTSNGSSSAPTWQNVIASDLSGGAEAQIPFQAGVGDTTFNSGLQFDSNTKSLKVGTAGSPDVGYIILGGSSGYGYVTNKGTGKLSIITQPASAPGVIEISAGNATSAGSAADVTIKGGACSVSSSAGDVFISGGATTAASGNSGNVFIAGGSSTSGSTGGHIYFRTATTGSATDRIRIKNTGSVYFVPLATAPASPLAGEVYFDSTLGKLRCYDGSAWNNLF